MRELFYSSDAINWIWYGTLVVNDETKRAYVHDSYRLHRSDERQGANQHPETDYRLDGCYNDGGPASPDYHNFSITNKTTRETEYFIACDMIEGEVVPRPCRNRGILHPEHLRKEAAFLGIHQWALGLDREATPIELIAALRSDLVEQYRRKDAIALADHAERSNLGVR